MVTRAQNSSATTVVALALIFVAACATPAAEPPAKPKIRAVTAFIRLDRAQYKTQIAETLVFLRKAKATYEKTGYEVESIRITTQPFPEYTKGLSPEKVLEFFRDYDALAVKEGFDAAIGPAMMKDSDDAGDAELLGIILSRAKTLEGSISIAGQDGIHWQSIHAAALVIKYLEDHTAHGQGNFSFTAAALVPSGTPFYPASYLTGPGKQFALALQSANVVAEALTGAKSADAAEARLKNMLGRAAQEIEKTAEQLALQTGWKYEGIDLSPAPLKDISIGGAIEKFYGVPVGSSGTLTVAAIITRALRAIPVTHAGYSGLMIPVLEDSVLAQRWSEGRLTMDALLAYSAVCGTGLDTIPLPGDITVEQLTRILSDVASLAVKWHKPLSARLQPAPGRMPGEMTEFDDPFLVNAKIQPLP
ncbi:MAG TPA: DUF711 family protein [Candidatus Limnocylindria bacterium]|nr:DUF711 family protein [Candidatus Limnocylindria bacterium]